MKPSTDSSATFDLYLVSFTIHRAKPHVTHYLALRASSVSATVLKYGVKSVVRISAGEKFFRSKSEMLEYYLKCCRRRLEESQRRVDELQAALAEKDPLIHYVQPTKPERVDLELD